MQKNPMFVLAAMILAALLAACGGGASATPRPVNKTINMHEFQYDPTEIDAEPGAEVTLTLDNTGALIHSMYIMAAGYTAEAPFDEEDEPHALWHITVEPGATGTLTFTAPSEPGTYQIVCGVPGHLEVGMTGTLVVTSVP